MDGITSTTDLDPERELRRQRIERKNRQRQRAVEARHAAQLWNDAEIAQRLAAMKPKLLRLDRLPHRGQQMLLRRWARRWRRTRREANYVRLRTDAVEAFQQKQMRSRDWIALAEIDQRLREHVGDFDHCPTSAPVRQI